MPAVQTVPPLPDLTAVGTVGTVGTLPALPDNIAAGRLTGTSAMSRCRSVDKRPARFTDQSLAAPPGINSAASFHEAHYVAHVVRQRNRQITSPFATDGIGVDLGVRSGDPLPIPMSGEVANFAAQAPLPPVGRPGHGPLPTEPLDAKDSYHFARLVQGHARMLNSGLGNNLISG
mmetsp:Transcript_92762/g.198884  ORF Transcript_92762/g.198884 Transcript_92762/m.198884 type:complete len:175 (+) Transcript_92762:90-614(+)